MPELDVIYIQVCGAYTLADKVLSSKGDEHYDVVVSLDATLDRCTCMGFQFRRKCKHVDKLREKLCGWNEQIDDVRQTPQQEMEGICPKCGEETQVVRWGV